MKPAAPVNQDPHRGAGFYGSFRDLGSDVSLPTLGRQEGVRPSRESCPASPVEMFGAVGVEERRHLADVADATLVDPDDPVAELADDALDGLGAKPRIAGAEVLVDQQNWSCPAFVDT